MGIVQFGNIPSDVDAILGPPSREIQNPDDENELIWEYNDHKLRLTFYHDESNRLGYLRCSHPALTIVGHRIIGRSIDEVISLIDPRPESWEIEEYFTFITYFLVSQWLTLNVEYGRVTDIELGVPFSDKDEYDWPQIDID